MEHPPRAGLRYELLMDEGSGLGMIPRGTTVLVTEGHISPTAVIRISSTPSIADGRKYFGMDMGTAPLADAPRASEDNKSASYTWMYMASGHKTDASF